MYALVYRDSGLIHMVLREPPLESNHNMKELDVVRIPPQDCSHIRDEYGNWTGTLSDLRLYTKEEQAALDAPRLAREELAKTNATEAKSIAALAARVALIEKVLGV